MLQKGTTMTSHIKELPEDGAAPTATTSPKNGLEILMSQMHDLSFMLERALRVPLKLDGHILTHQD